MSGPKYTPAWERVVTLDDHDALKRELAEERDRAKRLAAVLKASIPHLEELEYALRNHVGDEVKVFAADELLDFLDNARAALREVGVES